MKALFVVFLLIICMSISGQKSNIFSNTYQSIKQGVELFKSSGQRANLLCASYQFIDAGIGLKYERLFWQRGGAIVGSYISGAWGNYHFREGYIKNHWKGAFGFTLSLVEPSDPTIMGFFTAGLSVNKYGESEYNLEYFDPVAFNPISGEFGCGNRFKIKKSAFNMGIRYDPFKGEATLDIGGLF